MGNGWFDLSMDGNHGRVVRHVRDDDGSGGPALVHKESLFENRGGVALETPLCTRDFPLCTLYSSGALYTIASAGTNANT